jgi:hypothetical protein
MRVVVNGIFVALETHGVVLDVYQEGNTKLKRLHNTIYYKLLNI